MRARSPRNDPLLHAAGSLDLSLSSPYHVLIDGVASALVFFCRSTAVVECGRLVCECIAIGASPRNGCLICIVCLGR